MALQRRRRYRGYGYAPWCGCWHHGYAPFPPPPPWCAEEPEEDTEREALRSEIADLKACLREAEERLARLETAREQPQG